MVQKQKKHSCICIYGPKTKKKHSCIYILDTTVLDDSMELEQKNCYRGD